MQQKWYRYLTHLQIYNLWMWWLSFSRLQHLKDGEKMNFVEISRYYFQIYFDIKGLTFRKECIQNPLLMSNWMCQPSKFNTKSTSQEDRIFDKSVPFCELSRFANITLLQEPMEVYLIWISLFTFHYMRWTNIIKKQIPNFLLMGGISPAPKSQFR